jgi:hypothetical protein
MMKNLNITNALIKAGAYLDTQASMLFNQYTIQNFWINFNLLVIK